MTEALNDLDEHILHIFVVFKDKNASAERLTMQERWSQAQKACLILAMASTMSSRSSRSDSIMDW